MKLNEDEELWQSLDTLLTNCEEDLNRFLNKLAPYAGEMDLIGQAVLFGGLGKLVFNYNLRKHEHPPLQAVALAFQEVQNDIRVKQMMGIAVEKAIDSKVETMKGDEI